MQFYRRQQKITYLGTLNP